MSRFVRGSHVAWQILGDEAVLVDLSKGKTLGLNGVGALVWRELDESPLTELIEKVTKAFSVDEERASRDVASFLDDLDRRGLVVRKDG